MSKKLNRRHIVLAAALTVFAASFLAVSGDAGLRLYKDLAHFPDRLASRYLLGVVQAIFAALFVMTTAVVVGITQSVSRRRWKSLVLSACATYAAAAMLAISLDAGLALLASTGVTGSARGNISQVILFGLLGVGCSWFAVLELRQTLRVRDLAESKDVEKHSAVIVALSEVDNAKDAADRVEIFVRENNPKSGQDLLNAFVGDSRFEKLSWQAIAKTIKPHIINGRKLPVLVLTSEDSDPGFDYFKKAIECHLLPGLVEFSKWSDKIDFEDFGEVYGKLPRALRDAASLASANSHSSIQHRSPIIDATGGQRPFAIAVAAYTLTGKMHGFTYVSQAKDVARYYKLEGQKAEIMNP